MICVNNARFLTPARRDYQFLVALLIVMQVALPLAGAEENPPSGVAADSVTPTSGQVQTGQESQAQPQSRDESESKTERLLAEEAPAHPFTTPGKESDEPFSRNLGTILPVVAEDEMLMQIPRIYKLEGKDEVYGYGNMHYLVRGHETLIDLAIGLGLGFNEIYDRNPDVSIWIPPAGSIVQVPLLWVLPRASARSTIVVNVPEMRLYHRLPDGSIESFPVGVGREGWETPFGHGSVTDKKKDPIWIVPDSIMKENPDHEKIVRPGPDNPLGDRAIYLTFPGYRIHGTNQPYGVGRRVSHGCIRLYPEDARYLFNTVRVGDSVSFVDEPVKVGWLNDDLYMEVHEPLQDENVKALPAQAEKVIKEAFKRRSGDVVVDWKLVAQLVDDQDGAAHIIGYRVQAPNMVPKSTQAKMTNDLLQPEQPLPPLLPVLDQNRPLAINEEGTVVVRPLTIQEGELADPVWASGMLSVVSSTAIRVEKGKNGQAPGGVVQGVVLPVGMAATAISVVSGAVLTTVEPELDEHAVTPAGKADQGVTQVGKETSEQNASSPGPLDGPVVERSVVHSAEFVPEPPDMPPRRVAPGEAKPNLKRLPEWKP